MCAVEQLVICASLHNKHKLSGLCRELITKTVERKYVTQKAAQQLVQKFNFEGSFLKMLFCRENIVSSIRQDVVGSISLFYG